GLARRTGTRCQFYQAVNEVEPGSSRSTRNTSGRDQYSRRYGQTRLLLTIGGTVWAFVRHFYLEDWSPFSPPQKILNISLEIVTRSADRSISCRRQHCDR